MCVKCRGVLLFSHRDQNQTCLTARQTFTIQNCIERIRCALHETLLVCTLFSLLEKNCSSVNTAAQPSVIPIPKNIMYQHTALEKWSELLSVHVGGRKRQQVKDRVMDWHISRWWPWTTLVISVVGSNPRRLHFQVYLKCVRQLSCNSVIIFSELNTSTETTLK